MELYQLAALQGFGDPSETQNLDGIQEAKEQLLQDRLGLSTAEDVTQEHEVLAVAIVSFLLLIQNVYFCYRTTVDAAKAYEYVCLLLNLFFNMYIRLRQLAIDEIIYYEIGHERF